ncbi:DUF3103 family protein [Streptomyces anandii]|uniref:DUF3103 family protein n=1 Tax=Streptomyces anandii TaxID=285454 RepID=UPI0036F82B2B
MRPRHRRRRGAAAAVAATLLALSSAQAVSALPASAGPAASGPATPAAPVSPASHASGVSAVTPDSAVPSAEEDAARALARSLTDPVRRERVREAVLASGEVPLTALARGGLKAMLAAADQRIAAAKGLDAGVGPLLRLRLGDASMSGALGAGTAPWVAAAGVDDDAPTVVAYDSRGRAHRLDARHVPDRPVYVVDIDGSRALAAGLGVLDAQLRHYGLASATPAPTRDGAARAPRARAATAGFWTTRVTAVELADDEEPWIKGDAEIYTLVTGFGQDGKVRVDPVDMPYLDNDGTVYRPGQILVNWSYYKYDLADAVMMEDDGGTNYHDLAEAIATALLTITDHGAYIPLVDAVLDAIPDDWWTDDPDYVDSWYTLSRTDDGTRHGARGNGWMTLEPYFVRES